MGSSWSTDIGTGVEDYVEYLYTSGSMSTEYTATTTDLAWGIFTWDIFVAEINAGRPVLLGVDSSASGSVDHSIVAIGYDSITHQYACHRTWEIDDPTTTVDEALFWYDFAAVSPGREFGIGSATLVEMAVA